MLSNIHLVVKYWQNKKHSRNKKTTVISITESKLDTMVIGPESYIDNYEVLRFDKNHNGEDDACYFEH